MNVYLLVLTGQGDTEIRVVDQETWDWIFGPSGQPEGESGWEDPHVPAYQRRKSREEEGEENDFYLTSGSWQNDRALHAYSSERYDAETFDGIKDVLKVIKKKGDTIAEEFHGCIY